MHVANLPTYGPRLILFPALSDGDPSGGTGYVPTRPTHLWAGSDFVPRSEALGTSEAIGVL